MTKEQLIYRFASQRYQWYQPKVKQSIINPDHFIVMELDESPRLPYDRVKVILEVTYMGNRTATIEALEGAKEIVYEVEFNEKSLTSIIQSKVNT